MNDIDDQRGPRRNTDRGRPDARRANEKKRFRIRNIGGRDLFIEQSRRRVLIRRLAARSDSRL
jgi:hypothetical protein